MHWSLSGEGGRSFKEKEASNAERWRQEIGKHILEEEASWPRSEASQQTVFRNVGDMWVEADLVRKKVRGQA